MNIPPMNVRQVKGNEPLLLNDPQTTWTVKSGSLAVFVVQIQAGSIAGERRYLFTVSAPAALFGVLTVEHSFSLIAVALEPTELLPVQVEHLLQPCASSEQVASDAQASRLAVSLPSSLAFLDAWIHLLGQIEGFPPAPPSSQPTQVQYISLLPGQVFQATSDQVLWVRMQQGRGRWFGHPELYLDENTGCFPLGKAMWLEAEDHLELFARPTSEVTSSEVLVKGLAQLHTYFLQGLSHLHQQEVAAVIQRFQVRQRLNQQVTQNTIRDLASVLKPQQDDFLHADTPLLMAAGAVGKAMGVTIEPPMQSENLQRLKDPLEAIARASQLRLRRVLLRGNWWQRDGGPILAYTREDHQPVALLPVSNTHYELFDPIQTESTTPPPHLAAFAPSAASLSPSTPRVQVNETIAHTLDPVAFMFYRPLPSGKLSAFDLLKFALRGRQRDLLMILLTGVAATLLGMLIPQATALLINRAIPYRSTSLVMQLGLGLLAVAVGNACFQLGQAIASMRLETSSDASMQAAVWDRLLKLRTSFFRQYSTGDLNSRVSGISAIRRRLSGTVLQTIFSSFFALLNLGLLFYYSAKLAVLALIVAVVVGSVTIASGILLIRKNRPLIELEGEIFGLVVQLINGVGKLRISGVEERAFAQWGQKYVRQLRLTLSTQKLEDGLAVFNTIMPTLTTVALFWLASTLIQSTNPAEMISSSGLTAGDFLAFNVAFGTFIGGVTNLSDTIVNVLDIIPLWQRSQPILAAEPEVNLNKADPGQLGGHIHVDHVMFRYREDGAMILDDVSLEAKPGEFIALVGASGSGKSTLLRLLLGFETPISGTVYYDGQDLAGLDVSAVRRQLGVVLQNNRINAGSIFENIASGALIGLDDAWKAAEMAGLADEIRALPMQMHTLISEGGSNLSGGQRQRLVIARALALQPHVLLFDEATSALDNRTQAIVSQSLDRLNVTRIVIAHRLSTIRNADRIYVLAAGRVMQQGSFEELAHQPGLFAQLMRRQLA
ncbi:MAG: NHLP bacteriocin export ABC transporter permease/ATPase subunit [Cyanobacteria bacterium RM1_2_2]|nr:NHLP bacteriocin export ABC transporter permease/ATPase subunit [Cyanobacteria bacterium RM1_2_2]